MNLFVVFNQEIKLFFFCLFFTEAWRKDMPLRDEISIFIKIKIYFLYKP